MCACSNVCVPKRACVYAGDGWTDGQRMERLMDLNVCMSVRACVSACATLLVCVWPCLRGWNDRC